MSVYCEMPNPLKVSLSSIICCETKLELVGDCGSCRSSLSLRIAVVCDTGHKCEWWVKWGDYKDQI